VIYDDVPFDHHEPCPRCGSRDNLGVWKDGHKFCFGCGYWESSPDSITNIKRKLAVDNNNNGDGPVFDPDDYTYALPDKARAWLDKYGITRAEVTHFDIMWNKNTDSLVFPVIIGGKITLTSERYFGPDPNQPKYKIKGQKNNHNLFITNKNQKGTVVFVEDFLSAIKVGRFVGACPLFGSTVGGNALKWAIGNFSKIRVWLDYDKAGQSVVEASKLSQYCSDVRSIISTLDPKEYSNNDLRNILEKYNTLGGLTTQ
jgi:Zn ribbon nucleic-acid-binding protein